MKHLGMIALAFVLLALAGCGGSSSSPDGAARVDLPALNTLGHPARGARGPGLPAAAPDDFNLGSENSGHSASAVYFKYFSDTVNAQSSGRWATDNSQGKKAWTLSNAANSAPKSWLMGGNYWNGELDGLESNSFTVADTTDGLRLSFYARWSIDGSDELSVWWNHGAASDFVTAFSGSSNPDYPGYTRYAYDLPGNFSGNDEASTVEFDFESDGSVTDYGVSLDDVAVYKRVLNPPLSVVASDNVPSEIHISWSHNNNGTLTPVFYYVMRATSENGTYTQVGQAEYPDSSYVDQVPDMNTYWYKVVSRRTGWPLSEDSNKDSGHAL